MEDKYNDLEILDTVIDNQSKELLFSRLLSSVDNDMYLVYSKIINRKLKYSLPDMDTLNSKIFDVWKINIQELYNIEEFELDSKLSLYLKILDAFHIQLPIILNAYMKNKNINTLEEISDINDIIKLTKSNLKSIFRLLDYNSVWDILTVCFNIYGNYIVL